MDRINALVIGATGIVGGNLLPELLAKGWTVYGLARRPEAAPPGTIPIKADLNDAAAVQQALAGVPASHVFFTTWTPCPTETEACAVNRKQVRHVLDALRNSGRKLQHVVLVTGVKHYQGPFTEFGWVRPETPFQEDEPRLPVENFYYDQEDEVFAAAERDGFTWSVHRPNAIVGFAIGSLMNTGMTIACYASLCRATGRPFAFTGVESQWNGLTEVSDARLIARQLFWAATSPAAHNQAFNTANGDVFRWRRMWPVIGAYFGLEVPPYNGERTLLQEVMADAGPIWAKLARKHDLIEPDLGRLATWWHSDFDFSRAIDSISDMTKSRKAGFLDYQSTRDTFFDLFQRLQAERIIPRADVMPA